jgi:hypothetical protein
MPHISLLYSGINFKCLKKIDTSSRSLTLIDVIASQMFLSSSIVWGLFEYTLFHRFARCKNHRDLSLDTLRGPQSMIYQSALKHLVE